MLLVIDRNFIAKCLDVSGSINLFKTFLPRPHVVVLAYHKVHYLKDTDNLLKDLIVQPDDLDKQLFYIKQHYQIVSLGSLCQIMRTSGLKENLAVITLDDAYEDNFIYAFPIFKKYMVPATIFVSTGFIETAKTFYWDFLSAAFQDNTNMNNLELEGIRGVRQFSLLTNKDRIASFIEICKLMKFLNDQERLILLDQIRLKLNYKSLSNETKTLSWAQIREMKNAGITFGAHTHNHLCLSILRDEEVEREISFSKSILDQQLNQDTKLFAFPFGDQGTYDQRAIKYLASLGFDGAVTMNQGHVEKCHHSLELKRIGLGGYDTIEIFRLKLCGCMHWMNRLKLMFYVR